MLSFCSKSCVATCQQTRFQCQTSRGTSIANYHALCQRRTSHSRIELTGSPPGPSWSDTPPSTGAPMAVERHLLPPPPTPVPTAKGVRGANMTGSSATADRCRGAFSLFCAPGSNVTRRSHYCWSATIIRPVSAMYGEVGGQSEAVPEDPPSVRALICCLRPSPSVGIKGRVCHGSGGSHAERKVKGAGCPRPVVRIVKPSQTTANSQQNFQVVSSSLPPPVSGREGRVVCGVVETETVEPLLATIVPISPYGVAEGS
eukprot:2897399-Rhodomonas_salina.8